MRNAALMSMEFQSMLPQAEAPMYTEGYEGFYHLDSIHGDVEKCELYYIIRDHDLEKFKARKERFTAIGVYLNGKYGEGTFATEVKDTYYNMKEIILPHMEIVDKVKEAMADLGIDPIITPIRGGTDGAMLSYMGLPCPNLCTGGCICHSRFEFVSVPVWLFFLFFRLCLRRFRRSGCTGRSGAAGHGHGVLDEVVEVHAVLLAELLQLLLVALPVLLIRLGLDDGRAHGLGLLADGDHLLHFLLEELLDLHLHDGDLRQLISLPAHAGRLIAEGDAGDDLGLVDEYSLLVCH